MLCRNQSSLLHVNLHQNEASRKCLISDGPCRFIFTAYCCAGWLSEPSASRQVFLVTIIAPRRLSKYGARAFLVENSRMNRALRIAVAFTLVFAAARALVLAAEALLSLDKTLASIFETKSGKPWAIPSGQTLASLYRAAPSGHVWDLRTYRRL